MPQLDLFANYPEQPQPKVVEKVVVDIAAVKIKPTDTQQFGELAIADIPPPIAIENTVVHKTAVVESATAVISTRGKRGRKSFKEMDADIVMVEVPDDEILFQKQYYSMSEVAKWFHVNQSLLRYWENEFSVLKPRKTRKGDRLFRPEDVKNLQLIYFLLRQRKFSIEGARQYLKDNRKKADTQMQLIQSLTKFRAFLLEWRANLGA